MGRRAARATHLALSVLGAVLYFVFVIPRWWVLTGDLPATLATVGRIATGVPIAAAAVPVALTLQDSLKPAAGTPELALRLRAWSAVLHLVSGVLIIATAVAEIWLSLQAAGPWLFAVYGGAGAAAVLAALAFVLSFTAEKPPAPPKPAKPAKPAKATKAVEAGSAADEAKKPARKRRTRKGRTDEAAADAEPTDTEIETAEAETAGDAEPPAEPESAEAETTEATEAEITEATEAEITETTADETNEPEASSDEAPEKRPTGKNRHRLRR